ncbi:MAG: glycosyltransferase family 87 protein [Christensenellaceae bacterium]
MKRNAVRLRGLTKKQQWRKLFPILTLIAAGCFLAGCTISCIVTGYPWVIGSSLFFGDWTDFFMDFFNVNSFVADMNPYFVEGDPGGGSSYPPLVLLLAKFFQLVGGTAETPRHLRTTARGIFSCVLYYGIFFAAAGWLLKVFFDRHAVGRREGVLLALSLLFSAPMVYLIDRGNYLLYTLLFIAAFFLWKDDETKWKRELAALSLAVAVGFKLYPAVFALLYLKERRIGLFFRTACYGVLLTVLPFLAFRGGFQNVAWFFENLSKFSGGAYFFELDGELYTNSFSGSVSMAMAVKVLWLLFSGKSYCDLPEWTNVLSVVLTAAICLIALVGMFVSDKRWMSAFFASAILILLPDPNYPYAMAVLIIPFLLFLTEEEARGETVCFVHFCLLLLTAELGFILPRFSHGLQHGYATVNFVQCLACISLTVTCFLLQITRLMRKDRHVSC